MSSSSYTISQPDDDHIYYNANFFSTHADQDTVAKFDTQILSPFIQVPQDYHMSVVRFSIPNDRQPIFIFDDTTDAYQVSISFQTTDFYTTSLVYTPENNTITSTDPTYFYVYSYTHMIDMINTALSTSFTAMKTAHAGASPTVTPILSYDSTTGLISLFAESSFQTDPCNIYINGKLWSMLKGFPYFEYLNTSLSTSPFFQLLVEDLGTNEVSADPPHLPEAKGDWVQMRQEYNSLVSWNDMISIVLISSSISTKPEYLPSYDASGILTSGLGGRKIISDFIVNPSNGSESRGTITYIPTAEYRRIDLLGQTPMERIDLQFFWQSANQTLYPMYIGPYQAASCKLLFEKKH